MDRALDLARDVDQSQNGTGKETLQTVIELPSGAIAVKKNLKASEYFAMKRRIASAKEGQNLVVEATQELMCKMFTINGHVLTVDTLEEMPIDDIAVLDADINALFMQASNRKKS